MAVSSLDTGNFLNTKTIVHYIYFTKYTFSHHIKARFQEHILQVLLLLLQRLLKIWGSL